MTEWSQLPGELVAVISKSLLSEIDYLRFRSVCSSWRSAVPPKPFPSPPSRFPILPNHGISDTSWGFYLSRRIIYCLLGMPPRSANQSAAPAPSPSSSNNSGFGGGWIIKLDSDNPIRMRLLNPLSRSKFALPPDFPKYFDFTRFYIRELGTEYALHFINYRPLANSVAEAGNLYMEKVAVSLERDGFLLLTIHVSGKLVMYKSGDSKWVIINDFPSPYDDVIFHEDSFYAVDNTGRAVVLSAYNQGSGTGSGPSVNVVAGAVFGGDKKYLVESCGDLLMVDMFLSAGPEDDLGYTNEDFEFYEEFDCLMSERTVKFKVYKLDKVGHRWSELTSLGDRILFLGDNCTFSASAAEINSECKGNCIFFTNQFSNSKEDDGLWKLRSVGVFNLENGNIGPIGSYNGFSEMFWPPPSWVYPTMSIEAELMSLLNI